MKKKYILVYFDSKTRQNFYLNTSTKELVVLESKTFFNVWYVLGITFSYTLLRTIPIYIYINLNLLILANLIVGVFVGLIIEHFRTIKISQYLDTQVQVKQPEKINEIIVLGKKQLPEHLALLVLLFIFSIGCSAMLLADREKFLIFFLSIVMWTIFTISCNSIDYVNRKKFYKKN